MTDQAGHCPLGFNQLGKFVEKSLRRHHVEKKDAIEVKSVVSYHRVALDTEKVICMNI